ncbi:hypothetical protein HNQ59_000873 [Chitinivorax tropicus]|uniref:MoaD/ThiS family protein n=1 Tax=Chitinivorax tropicus TaxID=714531 RepID=A0A840ME99_9PROT|nr:MoaD/ThiS family protein [Chitinivorax tropicus]MBB5017604.1 hypothetical protein [Chitinivorax tropicus]
MPTVAFTPHLQHYLPVAPVPCRSLILRALLDEAFAAYPAGRLYVLDEQGRVRRHIAIFVDGMLQDREKLDIPLRPDSSIYIMQALSGG